MSINEISLDLFLNEIDKAISSGNIIYIRKAINLYETIIDKSYILWANNIALQIIEEKYEDILI